MRFYKIQYVITKTVGLFVRAETEVGPSLEGSTLEVKTEDELQMKLNRGKVTEVLPREETSSIVVSDVEDLTGQPVKKWDYNGTTICLYITVEGDYRVTFDGHQGSALKFLYEGKDKDLANAIYSSTVMVARNLA